MNSIVSKSREVPVDGVALKVDISVPNEAKGIVLFAHGSGSSRSSPRNLYVARELHSVGLATVLADLLTADEEQVDARGGQIRFDIDLLSLRLVALTDWIASQEGTGDLGLGLFGASTGAAAALVAAASRQQIVAAVVSRGGRPDLAGQHLHLVRQPTLLIVGERDDMVVELNREALTLLSGETSLEIVPGASHLFEEPGALEEVARLAQEWFVRHLRGKQPTH